MCKRHYSVSSFIFEMHLKPCYPLHVLTTHVLFCYRFRIDNTDHIIDVNKGNYPFEYDQVNIICPVYTPGTHEEDAEKYIIYNVSAISISNLPVFTLPYRRRYQNCIDCIFVFASIFVSPFFVVVYF